MVVLGRLQTPALSTFLARPAFKLSALKGSWLGVTGRFWKVMSLSAVDLTGDNHVELLLVAVRIQVFAAVLHGPELLCMGRRLRCLVRVRVVLR